MNHASLFTGIGGFDLAAEWMGWKNVFAVEKEAFCQKVLKKNFPEIAIYGDIYEFDGTKYKGQIDIITGGFPCQPFSQAGKRKGRNDDRYLWPEMLRVIREVKPSFVIGENVTGLVTLENGKTIENIYSSLESEGYTVESFIIPACAVKGWHRRDRIWIIAYSPGVRRQRGEDAPNQANRERDRSTEKFTTRSYKRNWFSENWSGFKARFIRVVNGVSPQLDRYERGRLKALGNAIVPQVAYELFKAIDTIR